MQFKYIYIKNLFGLYNYNIEFFREDENKLTILTAPNGKNAIPWEHCLCHVKSKCNNARLGHFPTAEMMELFVNDFTNP